MISCSNLFLLDLSNGQARSICNHEEAAIHDALLLLPMYYMYYHFCTLHEMPIIVQLLAATSKYQMILPLKVNVVLTIKVNWIVPSS